MKVHGHPLSSCTRKVLMTLAEKGQRAEFELVDLMVGAHKSGAHLKRHPFGVIPVLEDEDFSLYESRAILRYLEARFPAPSLVPRDGREVARMDQWLSVDQSYVAPHTRTLAVERILKPHHGEASDAGAIEAAEAALARAFAVLDAALERAPYLAGETFSLADVSLVPYVASLEMIGARRLLDAAPRLAAWSERVTARPSWKAISG